jgi:hypothetical protein
MIPIKTPLIFASTLIVGTLLLSWTLFDDHEASSMTSSPLSYKDKLSDGAMYGLPSGDGPSSQGDYPPSSADDVLVQRISGDNDHMLMMAYYSKENYSGPSFTIENGYTITFRDDGQ